MAKNSATKTVKKVVKKKAGTYKTSHKKKMAGKVAGKMAGEYKTSHKKKSMKK